MQAEITNILVATQLSIQEGNRRNMQKCANSRSALTALQNTGVKSKFTMYCHKIVDNFAEERTEKLLRTPGHRGIRGNNSARLGAEQPVGGSEPAVGISDA